jgi:hypothetical protein
MIRAAINLVSLAIVAQALVACFAPGGAGAAMMAIVSWLMFKTIVLIVATIACAAIVLGSSLALLMPRVWPRLFCGVAGLLTLGGCMICMRSLACLIIA